MKRCSLCKLELSLDNFSKNKRTKDKLQLYCKFCRKKYYNENSYKFIEYSKNYRKNNPEKIKFDNKKYYENNSEKEKLRRKKYYSINFIKEKRYQKKYYKENIDVIKKHKKTYRINNLEKERMRGRTYYKNNPQQFKTTKRKYRKSSKGMDIISNYCYGVSVSDMLKWQGNKCAICGETKDGKRLDIDHDHKTKQVRMLLCRNCNTGTKITDNWQLLLAKSEYIKTYSP